MKPTMMKGAAGLALSMLAASASAADAPACNTGRAQTLSIGASLERSHGGMACRLRNDGYNSANAHDGALYRFTLPATTAIELRVVTDNFPADITVFQPDGTEVVEVDERWHFPDSEKPRETSMAVTLPAGTYYAAVEKGWIYPSMRYGGDSYRIQLRDLGVQVAQGAGGKCEDDERAAARRAGAKTVSLDGAPVSDVLGVADCVQFESYQHFHFFDVPTRRTVEVKAETGSFPADVGVLDAAGIHVQTEEDQDKADAVVRTELAAGRYMVKVSNDRHKLQGGAYKLTVRTVGTPGTDTSKGGAVCAGPDTIGTGKTTLRGVLTEASCKRADGQTFHSYTFTTTRPQRLSIWDGSVEFQVVGPKGPVARTNDNGYGGLKFAETIPAGRYTLNVSLEPYSDGRRRNEGRIELPVELRDAIAGEDGGSCGAADILPISPGRTVRGEMTSNSCSLRMGRSSLPAAMYKLALAAPREVEVVLTPAAGFEPLLGMTNGAKWVAGEPKTGAGARRIKLALPAGEHTIAVFAQATGSYTMSVK